MKSIYHPRLKDRFVFFLWTVILFTLSGYLFSALQVRSDISFFLPNKSSQIDNVMLHQLKEGAAGKIILIALQANKNNPVALKTMAQLNKNLTADLKQNDNFTMVQNGQMSLSDLIIEPYYHYRYLLYSPADDKPDPFSKQELSFSFDQLLQRLQLIISTQEQKLFAEDPQMIWLALLKQWQTQHLQKHFGVWFDKTKQQTLLFVKTRANAYDLVQQQQNISYIKERINFQIKKNITSISDLNNSIIIKPVLTGAPVFALASKNSISYQIKIISVFASFTLMAFLYWFFRSIKVVLFISLPLVFAILAGLSCVILFDGFIHGITIAFGITIIGIAVDYPVHFYSHLLLDERQFKHQNNPLSNKSIILSIWPMLRLGLITTLIGFSAITLSDFSGLRQLGLFAISGLFAAAMVTRFLLPIIPVKNKKNSNSGDHSIELTINHTKSAYQLLLRFVHYPLPRIFFPIAIALPFLALVFIVNSSFFLHNDFWQKDLAALSPIPHKQKQYDFDLRKAMGLPELRFALILQNSSLQDLLQQSEKLKPELDNLKQKKIISGYDMAAHYLPSFKKQKLQQQKLPGTEQLKFQLETILQTSELDSNAFTPFIQAVENSKKQYPLSEKIIFSAQEKSNFITDKIKTLLYEQNLSATETASSTSSPSIWTAIIPLQGVQDNLQSHQALRNFHIPVQLLDLKTQAESMLTQYRNEALLLFFFGSLLILLILLLSHRKLSALFLLAWPFTGAILLTISSLLILGYSLSIFHLVTLLLVVGLAIDYSIFTLSGSNSDHKEVSLTKDRKKTMQSSEVSQVSVIICMFSTIIMFGALALSDLPILKAIGLTASLGALYAFLLTRFLIVK
jgi:predicted exporter